ncbi:MAG: RagB/SusD family nutrient uptake outer membrane protein [Ferruginibacter sp.]
MKQKNIFTTTIVLSVAVLLGACTKDLDRKPLNSNTSELQYSTPAGYKQVLAKVYGSYSLVSSTGVGNFDVNVAGITDAGTTDFIRAYWNLQELTTDEALCAWNDVNLQSFHNLNWTSSNIFINALYARSLFQVTVCNEFIRESSDEKLAGKGFPAADLEDIKHYRAEARFLRAFQYWVLMDLFGNPPFVTENDPIGKYIPKQIQRKDLFNYVEAELKEIDGSLVSPKQNEYGRADQAAGWALLARLYLNAEVYTGTARYADAITYSSKVIGSNYTLLPHFKNLFMADNNVGNTENILSIAYDATNAQNYGGTTFLICSSHGTNVDDNKKYGIPGGGWLGNRSTKSLPLAFGDYSGNADKRAMFSSGTLEIASALNFNDGLSVTKFSNVNSDGTTPYSPNGVLVNTDFPLFRLAEMYLVYIEATKRGGAGGTAAAALGYFNKLRQRGYESTAGNVTSYTLDDVLNERQRELYWEGFRRTDLIRFGRFTSATYLWPWKAGVAQGAGADAHYSIFPIPSPEIISNTNLAQNPGY